MAVEKRLQIKAARNGGIAFRGSYAGGQVLPAHGLGNTDKMIGAGSGDFFGGRETEIGQAALKFSKRGTVNGVDNTRHPCPTSCQPPENSRLTAVCMNHVGTISFEAAVEGLKS